jgi:hypothetical protein
MRLELSESDTQSESNQGMRLQPDDLLLMCSDGLTDMVSDADILGILSDKPIDEAVDDLLMQANDNGGHDNITAIVIRVPETGFDHIDSDKPKLSLVVWGLVITALVLLVVLILFGGYYWSQNREDRTPMPTHSLIIEATSNRGDHPELSPTEILEQDISLTPAHTTHAPITSLTPTTDNQIPAATYTPWPTSTIMPTEINQ